MLLLQWQQQALRLLLRSLLTLSRETCFFCNGNNKHEKEKKIEKKISACPFLTDKELCFFDSRLRGFGNVNKKKTDLQ